MQSRAASMDGDKFDSLLTRLGTGRWNIMYFVASSFWYFIWPAMALSGVYFAPALNYTCRPPANATSLAEDSCSYVRMAEDGAEVEEPCTEWDFDDTVFTNTLTSEFQLVCGRAYLRATYQSGATVFVFIQLLWGFLADRFGRKMVLVPTYVLTALISIGISFLPSFSLVLVCRILRGAVNNFTLYLLAMEVCEVKQRSTVGILIGLPWALGTMAWGGVAYLIRDWRRLNLVTALPQLLILLVLWLDESPRWLAVTGKEEQATKVLRRAARMNKTELPTDEEMKTLMSQQREESEQKAQKQRLNRIQCGMPHLLSTPIMRRSVAILFVVYFATTLVFTGLTLSGAALSADPFLYMVLGGLMEVPGYTLTAPIISRWGRKVPIIIGYLVCGVTLVALAFVPSDVPWLVLSLAMTGKLAVSGAFMVLVVYVPSGAAAHGGAAAGQGRGAALGKRRVQPGALHHRPAGSCGPVAAISALRRGFPHGVCVGAAPSGDPRCGPPSNRGRPRSPVEEKMGDEQDAWWRGVTKHKD